MRRSRISVTASMILALCLSASCQKVDTGPSPINYFDQSPPHESVELFAPGVISVPEENEYGGHFSPDGKEFYFTRFKPGTEAQVLSSRFENNSWSPPRPVSITNEFPGGESCISPDGAKFFYTRIIRRPDDRELDIFVSERSGDDWGLPHPATEIDLGTRRVCPSVDQNLDLYFSGDFDEPGNNDIYVSRFIDGKYQTPQNLGPAINSTSREDHVFVAPDTSYILFDSGRPGGFGGGDIYVSFRMANGTWGPAKNLGEPFNTDISDWYPIVTPDQNYLIFARSDSSGIDLYWSSADFLEDLRL